MAGWHHQCHGYEVGQTPGDGEGHGGLACCSPWGHEESDTTEQLSTNLHVHMSREFGNMGQSCRVCRTNIWSLREGGSVC